MCMFFFWLIVRGKGQPHRQGQSGMAGLEDGDGTLAITRKRESHGQYAWRMELLDGLALGGQPVNIAPDEFLQVAFAPDEEVSADSGELVCPAFGHVEGELFNLPPV